MKRIELDKEFTKKVTEYLMKGYTINTDSMGGSQGEVAKVDLVKGNELIRVWMNQESAWSVRDDKWTGDMIVIRVSRWSQPASSNRTVWMSELEHLEEMTYYKVNRYDDWYVVSYDEAKQIQDLQYERFVKDRTRDTVKDVTRPKSQEIGRKYLIANGIYKRIPADEIKVYRENHDNCKKVVYRIVCRGNYYYLG